MKRKDLSPREAFLCYRILTRINEQCTLAYQFGRDADGHSMGRLIGSLEYQIFGSASIDAYGIYSKGEAA